MNCQLKSLLSSKNQIALPFLDLADGELLYQQKSLACCDGKGFRMAKDGSVVTACSVKQRLHAVQKILYDFKRLWNFPIKPYEFSSKDFHVYWQWFVLYKHRGIIKGFLINCNSDEQRKFLANSLALMATWRVGYKTYVFNLLRQDIKEFIRFTTVNQNHEPPPIVFLELEPGLWGLQKKENITYIISWCEKHLWPLWIINKEPVQKQIIGETKVLQMFHKRISKQKQKSFLSWLDQETRSKLSTLCSRFPA